MTDLLGPASSGAVTARPADGRAFGAVDTWFSDCTSPSASDGTDILAGFLNALLANMRSSVRGMGIVETPAGDNLLRDAIYAARLRYALAGGTADALTVDFVPPFKALSTTVSIVVQSPLANSGAAMTINVDGLGAVPVLLEGAVPGAGVFGPGLFRLLTYSGGSFHVVGAAQSGNALPKLTMITATGTFVPDAATRKLFVLAHGPGGAGGGCVAGTAGSGGCPGGWALSLLARSAIGVSVACTVPAGGAGVSGAAGGTGGGSTSFGGYVVAGPGDGGGTGVSPAVGSPGAGTTGQVLGRGNPAFRVHSDGTGAAGDIGGNGGSGLLGGAGQGWSALSAPVKAQWGSGGAGADNDGASNNPGGGGGDGFILVVEV